MLNGIIYTLYGILVHTTTPYTEYKLAHFRHTRTTPWKPFAIILKINPVHFKTLARFYHYGMNCVISHIAHIHRIQTKKTIDINKKINWVRAWMFLCAINNISNKLICSNSNAFNHLTLCDWIFHGAKPNQFKNWY